MRHVGERGDIEGFGGETSREGATWERRRWVNDFKIYQVANHREQEDGTVNFRYHCI